MPYAMAALLGCLFLAGCASQPPLVVEPSEPPARPVVIEERSDPPDTRDGSGSLSGDEATRQRALRVFAAEQRNVLNGLAGETRFVRTTSGSQQRIRSALFASEQDLNAIEQAIESLDRDGSMSLSERRERHDDLKDRLRRLATRLSLMENAVRAR